MIGVGVWLELEERDFVAALETSTFLYGPYLIVAAGCAVVVVAVIGMVGAFCDHKVNRFLLYLVSCWPSLPPSPPVLDHAFSFHDAVHSAGADSVCSSAGWRDPGLCLQRPGIWICDGRTDSHSGSL